MSAAALVLLVTGVGVGYGWQPMSDGSNRYEYLVQVEPELLETLEEGRSIPIVSEVPAGIGPIGRIRITVGHGDLPRQRLVTDLKPAAESSAAPTSDIKLTQYNQYPAPTYAPQQPQTPAPQIAAAIDDAVASWNGGDTAAPQASGNGLRVAAAQTAPAVDPAATTWNGGTVPTAPSSSGPFGSMGDGLDRVTQPIRDGLDHVDNSVRDAASNLSDQTRKLASDLTQPITGGSTWPGTGTAPGAPSLPAPPWNGASQSAPAPQSAAARAGEPTTTWNNAQAPTAGTAAPPFAAATPQSSAAPGGISWPAGATPAPTSGGSNAQRIDQTIDPRDVGRWSNSQPAPSPTGEATGPGDSGALAAPPLTTGGRYTGSPSQPRLAAPTNSLPAGWSGDSRVMPPSDGRSAAVPDPFGASTPSASGASAVAGRKPSVEKRMLDQPADRQLEGVAGNLPLSLPAPPSTAPAAAPTTGQATMTAPTGAAGQGWDFATRNPSLSPTGQSGIAAPQSGAGPHAMTVLAAWVLLSGSVAGNLYLFWSYLDVRTKYRALVRKTARAVGSRFSAA